MLTTVVRKGDEAHLTFGKADKFRDPSFHRILVTIEFSESRSLGGIADPISAPGPTLHSPRFTAISGDAREKFALPRAKKKAAQIKLVNANSKSGETGKF